jgi:PPP family 3-phenylpropionic acid transporter
MPWHFLSPGNANFARRLALFYAALWLSVGIQLPFFPIWLVAEGLDSRTIGFLLAMPMLVRVMIIPITRAADRNDSVRRIMIFTCSASLVGYAALGFSHGLWTILPAFALAAAAFAPAVPLADAYALRGLADRGRSYGRARLWGSASFIVGNLGAGLLIDLVSPRNLIWLIIAAMVITVAAATQLGMLPPSDVEPARPRKPTTLWRDPALLAVIAAASVLQASHAVYYGFSSIAWSAAGFDGTAIAGLWTLGVLSEIALFAMSPRFSLGPTTMLAIGAAGGAIRWTAMALGPPLPLLPLLQCLHALSFGATHLGMLGFLVRATPAGLGATVQGYCAIAQGLVMALAMSLSGFLYADYGRHAYAAMTALSLCGGGLAWAARRLSAPDRV